jgi:DNA-binding GntR family transcriptional regulator
LSLRGNLERSLQEHREILDALRDRDGLRAAAAVGAHIHVPQLSIELEGENIFDGVDDGLRPHELAAD